MERAYQGSVRPTNMFAERQRWCALVYGVAMEVVLQFEMQVRVRYTFFQRIAYSVGKSNSLG
jgi:hypothetical protein